MGMGNKLGLGVRVIGEGNKLGLGVRVIGEGVGYLIYLQYYQSLPGIETTRHPLIHYYHLLLASNTLSVKTATCDIPVLLKAY